MCGYNRKVLMLLQLLHAQCHGSRPVHSGTLLSTLERTSYTGAVSDEPYSGFLLCRLHLCRKSRHPKQMRKIAGKKEKCDVKISPLLGWGVYGVTCFRSVCQLLGSTRIALVLVNVSPTAEFLCSGQP